jgi:Txe/YoeB family toxin of Txe-Axe toxin-antitoxin module
VFYIIEKQEKLQKDFEDEQVRRVVAEKKLEDLNVYQKQVWM